MSNFRETNWFKRGELVDETALIEVEGNEERPLEDRYLDQGTTSNVDSVTYGIHTGETTRIPPVKFRFDAAPDLASPDPRFASSVIAVDPQSAPDLQAMVRELKARNRTILAAIGAAALVVAAFVAVIA